MEPGLEPRHLGLSPDICPRWSDASWFLPGGLDGRGQALSMVTSCPVCSGTRAFPGCGTFSAKIKAALGKLG